MPTARHRSSAFLDVLLLPLLGAHRLVADAVHGVDFDLVVEHAEVAPDRDQRRVLVVKLHAQRSVHRLRDFGNRGGRLVADLVGVDDRGPSWPPTMAVTEGVPAIAPTVRSPMTALVQAHTD